MRRLVSFNVYPGMISGINVEGALGPRPEGAKRPFIPVPFGEPGRVGARLQGWLKENWELEELDKALTVAEDEDQTQAQKYLDMVKDHTDDALTWATFISRIV